MSKRYKVLITGSSGMLGVDLCRELEGYYKLFGTDIAQKERFRNKNFYKCDITQKELIGKLISRINPDFVIHAAAWTDVDGCELDKKKAYKINSIGTENVALACKKIGSTLIYISTDFVFNGRKNRPYKENDETDPLSVYGNSKLKGEEVIKKTLKKYFILRTSWLYGKHGKNFVDTVLGKAKAKKVLEVVDDQIGSPTYTKDLAKAIHVLLDKLVTSYKLQVTSYGIYHVSNSGSVSWYEYAKTILRLAKRKAKVVPISSAELTRPAKRPAMSILDNSRFIGFTGYKMRSWNNALKEYMAKKREKVC